MSSEGSRKQKGLDMAPPTYASTQRDRQGTGDNLMASVQRPLCCWLMPSGPAVMALGLTEEPAWPLEQRASERWWLFAGESLSG